MPSRSFAVLIVASWLLTTSWLVWTEVLPRLWPGTPPPFAVLLVEEAEQQRPPVRWTASRNGQKVFTVQTKVTRVGHEQYELAATYSPAGDHDPKGKQRAYVPLEGFLVSRMASAYRVNAEGDFLGLDVVIEGKPGAEWLAWIGDFTARISGDAEAGVLRPVATVEAGGVTKVLRLGEIEGPRRGGAVLMPLQPVNRVTGLHPGQRWTLHLFDPVGGLRAIGLGISGGPPLLAAAVRPELAIVERQRRAEPCFVIDYRGDGLEASTWVRQRDGLVLKQTARLDKDEWEIVRD